MNKKIKIGYSYLENPLPDSLVSDQRKSCSRHFVQEHAKAVSICGDEIIVIYSESAKPILKEFIVFGYNRTRYSYDSNLLLSFTFSTH
jgi:hypothetical protein